MAQLSWSSLAGNMVRAAGCLVLPLPWRPGVLEPGHARDRSPTAPPTTMSRAAELILSLHGWVALSVVFLVPALEASAFVGILFPGEIADPGGRARLPGPHRSGRRDRRRGERRGGRRQRRVCGRQALGPADVGGFGGSPAAGQIPAPGPGRAVPGPARRQGSVAWPLDGRPAGADPRAGRHVSG